LVISLASVRGVLVPIAQDPDALRGLGYLLATLDQVRSEANDQLYVAGFVASGIQERTVIGQDIVDGLPSEFGPERLLATIPYSVRVGESVSAGQPMALFAPGHPVTNAYDDLAKSVAGLEG